MGILMAKVNQFQLDNVIDSAFCIWIIILYYRINAHFETINLTNRRTFCWQIFLLQVSNLYSCVFSIETTLDSKVNGVLFKCYFMLYLQMRTVHMNKTL